VEQGFLELVPPLAGSNLEEEGDETEFESVGEKKRKRNDGNVNVDVDDVGADDPAIVELLCNHPKVFPPGAVWRVNVSLFHANLRAFALGRLVAERYQNKVPTAGSLVSAALKLVAHREHALDASSALSEEDKHQRIQDRTIFAPDDLLAFLPAPIVKDYQGLAGGTRANLSASLVKLSQYCTWPQVIIEVEDAIGHPLGGKFEVSTRQLVDHLQGRILNQVIEDSQGQVAARICSILQSKGQLESDAVAEAAMVPAKDVREVLHRLFLQNYIVLLTLQQTKQHNPSNAIYLWSIHKARMFQSVLHNVCQALQNIRLRRQHEMEVGRVWIERAKEASYLDENEHENDKANYLKFCQGLERLDCATLQLDETLMVLRDF
jgi:DNA-directed RNA polymerase III subunit RPC3